MSIRFRLSEADCITLNGIDHVLEHYDELGVILRARDASSRRLSFSHEEIMQLLSQPDVRLERDYFAAGQIARRARCDQRYLSSLTTRGTPKTALESQLL
ncbi:integrase, catalytic domain protein [Brucella canis]|nr:integrase, catalytic domain protein [Brucella canis]